LLAAAVGGGPCRCHAFRARQAHQYTVVYNTAHGTNDISVRLSWQPAGWHSRAILTQPDDGWARSNATAATGNATHAHSSLSRPVQLVGGRRYWLSMRCADGDCATGARLLTGRTIAQTLADERLEARPAASTVVPAVHTSGSTIVGRRACGWASAARPSPTSTSAAPRPTPTARRVSPP
jgi:hypothetical protein